MIVGLTIQSRFKRERNKLNKTDKMRKIAKRIFFFRAIKREKNIKNKVSMFCHYFDDRIKKLFHCL